MKYSSVLFSEIFTEFDKASHREARLAVLRKYGNDNVWFREFLNYAFNPKIRFDIDKIPNYKPAVEPAGLNYTSLNNEMRRLYIFIVGHPKRTVKLDPRKEERILNVLLGSVHKDEALLLVGLFNKKLGVKYLTAGLVKEAFPNMPWQVEAKEVKEAAEVAPVAVPQPQPTPIVPPAPKPEGVVSTIIKKVKAAKGVRVGKE